MGLENSSRLLPPSPASPPPRLGQAPRLPAPLHAPASLPPRAAARLCPAVALPPTGRAVTCVASGMVRRDHIDSEETRDHLGLGVTRANQQV